MEIDTQTREDRGMGKSPKKKRDIKPGSTGKETERRKEANPSVHASIFYTCLFLLRFIARLDPILKRRNGLSRYKQGWRDAN